MSGSIRRVVVTGGASGLGRAFVLELARRGSEILIADVTPDRLAAVVGEAEALGARAFSQVVDVRDAAQVEGLLRRAIEVLGGVDLWINNAGVAVAGEIGDVPLDDWRWVVDVNLWGVVHGCHVVVPHLRAQGHGWVLNVASAAGLISSPRMGPYNVTKAGVVSLTETLFGELADSGVGVTVLCPTFFQTGLLDTARTTDPRVLKLGARLMQRGRLDADGVARAALTDLLAGRLYSVPMADGRLMWRLVRALPGVFYRAFPYGAKLLSRR
ncbi:MAG TPA: SDR family NAD(P)-dependent oxidoreductase [Myxococcota bacterium]|nr:SDR family NAD(P)-dependent oxidoreductase [Myxococcota bacterium]